MEEHPGRACVSLQSWVRYPHHLLHRPCPLWLSQVLWWAMAEDSFLCPASCARRIPAPRECFERSRGTSAGSQLHSTTLIQILDSWREWGLAGPWGTSIRFFRGGQGPSCFPWSPIPGQLQRVRRSRGLDPLHSFPGARPMCPAELSAEAGAPGTKGGSRARGRQALLFGFPCKHDSCLLFPRQAARPCVNLAVDPLCPAPSLLILSPDWNVLRGDFLAMPQRGLDNCSCPQCAAYLLGSLLPASLWG